jgi:polar amino acid transport system substrate-binding protein
VLSLLRHLLGHAPRYFLLLAVLSSGLGAHAHPVVRIGTGDWVPHVDQQREDGGALSRLVRDIFMAAGYRVEFVYYP